MLHLKSTLPSTLKHYWSHTEQFLKRIKIVAAEPEFFILMHFSSLEKPGAYITYNAIQLLIEINVCCTWTLYKIWTFQWTIDNPKNKAKKAEIWWH